MVGSAPLSRPAFGGRVIRVAAASSTNELAKQLLRAGEPHGTVIVAREQSRGRGQRGRRWASPPGGLWVTLLARPALPASEAGLLNCAAGAAAAEAAAEVSGLPVMVKWPNDLLVAGRKVGGVLVETSCAGGRVKWAAIGIGINANFPTEALPRYLRPAAASLREETGREIPLERLLREVCARMQRMLRLLETGRDGEVVEAWRALDATVGRKVRASRGEGWEATAAAIDDAGRLVVKAADGRTIILTTSAGVVIE